MKIKIFITGGTIDNLEYDKPKSAPEGQKSLISGLLKQARLTVGYKTEKLIFKDSKFITDTERKLVANKCRKSAENKIIITHGTATMVDTAKYLNRADLNKTVILVGAVIPGNRPNSDALFNLGSAFAAVQLLPIGVYIAMNGKIFPANDVMKNLKKGIFEKIG